MLLHVCFIKLNYCLTAFFVLNSRNYRVDCWSPFYDSCSFKFNLSFFFRINEDFNVVNYIIIMGYGWAAPCFSWFGPYAWEFTLSANMHILYTSNGWLVEVALNGGHSPTTVLLLTSINWTITGAENELWHNLLPPLFLCRLAMLVLILQMLMKPGTFSMRLKRSCMKSYRDVKVQKFK